MDMIEIDPKLFVTCRLCLQETGQYQIVPKVQREIKFCFDIEVQPFDGLPQLICKKCNSILSQYVSTKQLYQEKQKSLETNVVGDNEEKQELFRLSKEKTPQDTVTSTSSTQLIDNVDIIKNSDVAISKTVTTTHLENNNHFDIEERVDKQLNVGKKLWKQNYTKTFACRFCSKTFMEKRTVKRHIRHHDMLLSSFKNIVKTNCVVPLQKVDQRENLTGSKKHVVYSKNKIIQNKNANYYVIFTLKSKDNESHNDVSTSSSDSDIFQRRRKRKRPRINSESSTDTVKIDDVTKSEQVEDFIELSDSDTVASVKSEKEKENSLEEENKTAEVNIFTKIENIVDICHNKIREKLEKEAETKKHQKNIESQLQHKVLSIGNKVISNQKFNCVGLLRYLEYKNLDVLYKSKSSCVKHVRIKTKVKERSQVTDECNTWANIEEITNETDATQDFSDILNNVLISKFPDVLGNNLYKSKKEYLAKNSTTDIEKQKILLNANPVPNPKQLPKKNLATEITIRNTDSMNSGNDNESIMPIIKCTVSLAGTSADTNNATEQTYGISSNTNNKPRIKVKPVSELMPENVSVNNFNQISTTSGDAIPRNNAPNTSQGNISPVMMITGNLIALPQQVTGYLTKDTATGAGTAIHYTNIVPEQQQPFALGYDSKQPVENETVILSTAEIPNATMKSPFRYFKYLLYSHNIILSEFHELTTHLTCLIKFKLVFQQEHRDPVTLCLALHGSLTQFALKITDNNSKIIRIEELTPSWQLEILNVFQGDVEEKLIIEANKISREMCETTKYFINLLKSIKCTQQNLRQYH